MIKISKREIDELYKLIVDIHIQIINTSGGEQGIRDEGGLFHSLYKLIRKIYRKKDSAIDIATFCYKEFSRNHYFTDGNKRTAHLIANIGLFYFGFQLTTNYKNATPFIIKIATYKSQVTDEEIKKWINFHLKPLNEKDIVKYLKEFTIKYRDG